MRVLVGRVDRRLGLGLLRRPRILETERRTMANVKHVRPTSPPSTIIVQHVTIQSKSASGARPSAELWMRILKLKIDCMRRQTPHRWVSSLFLTSYGLRFVSFSTFLALSSSSNLSAYMRSSYCIFSFVRNSLL
jgi:hypothetical protein